MARIKRRLKLDGRRIKALRPGYAILDGKDMVRKLVDDKELADFARSIGALQADESL